MCVYIYCVYILIHVYMCVCIEREKERGGEGRGGRERVEEGVWVGKVHTLIFLYLQVFPTRKGGFIGGGGEVT